MFLRRDDVWLVEMILIKYHDASCLKHPIKHACTLRNKNEYMTVMVVKGRRKGDLYCS